MTLQAVSNAATIALAGTLAMLLATMFSCILSRLFKNKRHFRNSIMVEAAEAYRHQLERLKREQTLSLMLMLMFSVTFGISALVDTRNMFGDLPQWQSILVLAVASTGICYVCYRLVETVVKCRHLAFVRDAKIAIGHSLQKLTANQNRIFHEVRSAAGIIDNVMVGPYGVYIIDVIAKRLHKENRLRIDGDKLIFSPGKTVISISESVKRAKQLAVALRKTIGNNVQVRLVIATPGWEVESQPSKQYLVVNERNLVMMQGWNDEKDYLMNEDVEAIQDFLTKHSTCS